MQKRTDPPRTPREFLERQQELEQRRLLAALQTLGHDLERSTDLDNRVRRHPVLACGLAAAAGFVLGPRVLPGLLRTLATAGIAQLLSPGRGGTLSALAPEILRSRLLGGRGRGLPF